MTTKIGEKAWETFQALEKSGGLFDENSLNQLKSEVRSKRSEREKSFLAGEIVLIGINKFANPEPVLSNWKELPSYLGIDALNYERISKTVSA